MATAYPMQWLLQYNALTTGWGNPSLSSTYYNPLYPQNHTAALSVLEHFPWTLPSATLCSGGRIRWQRRADVVSAYLEVNVIS